MIWTPHILFCVRIYFLESKSLESWNHLDLRKQNIRTTTWRAIRWQNDQSWCEKTDKIRSQMTKWWQPGVILKTIDDAKMNETEIMILKTMMMPPWKRLMAKWWQPGVIKPRCLSSSTSFPSIDESCEGRRNYDDFLASER